MHTFYKKSILGLLSFVLLFVALLLGCPQQNVQAASPDFKVYPVFSVGQTDPDMDYFSLSVQPKNAYQLAVTIENTSTTNSRTFEAKLAVATTTNDGKINYTPSPSKTDTTAKITLPGLTSSKKRQQKIALAPNSSETLIFPLHIPKNGIRGTVLGSVYVHQLGLKSAATKSGIQNEFAFTLPVVIQQKNSPKLMPKLTLDKIISSDHRLTAAIHNRAPVMFGEINLTTKIYRRHSDKIVYQQTTHNLEMAPNSMLNYTFTPEALKAGNYVLKIKLTSGQKSFHLQRAFTIKRNQQQKSGTFILDHTPRFLVFWLILYTILLILVIVILFALIKRFKIKHRHNSTTKE